MTNGLDPGRPLRVVVVDDEPLTRRAMRQVLERDPDLEVVAECGDGDEAIESIRQERPDFVLLDIQMPETDGFEVLRRLAPAELPCVIFVTAYDEYAVAAFEQQAVDYVLKPFSEERLREAAERAKRRVCGAGLSDLGQRVLKLIEAGGTARPPSLERLAIPKGRRTVVVEVDAIDWFEAADYYVRLHAGADRHLVRKPLKWFEEKLDPARFVRVHRSAIVNIRRVKEIRRSTQGDHVVVMPGEQIVPVSRAGRDALAHALG